jgi:hypothetical protein
MDTNRAWLKGFAMLSSGPVFPTGSYKSVIPEYPWCDMSTMRDHTNGLKDVNDSLPQ